MLAEKAAKQAKILPIPVAHRLLNDAYKKWVNTAELEIASITGVWPKVLGKKALPPAAQWAPVLHRPKQVGTAEAISDGWKWVYEQLRASENLRSRVGMAGAAPEGEGAPDPRLEFEAHVTSAMTEAMPGEGLHPQLDAAKASLRTLLRRMLDDDTVAEEPYAPGHAPTRTLVDTELLRDGRDESAVKGACGAGSTRTNTLVCNELAGDSFGFDDPEAEYECGID